MLKTALTNSRTSGVSGCQEARIFGGISWR
jgi:hypothetical protein